jgi:hypothetical protein
MSQGKSDQKSKKGKNRRKDRNKIARYWNTRHPQNMARRALRVLKTQGRSHMDRFVSLHTKGCKHCVALGAIVKRSLEA